MEAEPRADDLILRAPEVSLEETESLFLRYLKKKILYNLRNRNSITIYRYV